MSDFTSGFWNVWVIALTVGGIAFCAWLLLATGRGIAPPTDGAKPDTTGHVWDGDLAEYNNPLPKWWSNLFWITIVFAVVYLILYPGLGTFKGVLDWSSTGQYDKERSDVDARVKPLYDKYAALSVEKVAADPEARAMGERLFLNNCAQCHGSDAGGSRGFPNLRDKDWLYGGDPAKIVETITGGRLGVMPPLGAALGEQGTRDVVAYVRSLSGLPSDPLRAQIGKPLFAQNCAACHGADGTGNQAVGAPNLTDTVWLYGSSEATIAEGIAKGRNMNVTAGMLAMPSFKDTLGDARIHLVAAYVWGLSQPAAAK
ncbi:MAG TPA: cytochrome-c oxidase, cbb3-type subunit III [Casimicrobiaceae bacterium]|nr:cytochrome-c oxidase, cbb3-type subunit III [Casimicrobiaceae bacterium]